MPRRREGPIRDKRTQYFYFDEAVGFGEDKRRVRFSLRTQDLAKAQYVWEKEFKRQWDIYYGIKPAGPAKSVSFLEAGREYVQYAKDVKRIVEWQTAKERLNIVLDIIGDISLQKFSSEHIARIDAALTEAGRSKATVNHYFGLLKTFFFWAAKKGYYHGENPIREVKPYVVDEKRREYTPDELNRVIEAAGEIERGARRGAIVEKNIKTIILLLLYTGMRLGELLSLQWDNVQGDKIVVKRTETKQKKEKVIPISESVKVILDGLKDERRRDGFVLPLRRTGRTRPAWAYDALNKVRRLSGVGDFTFHGLRHTAATLMISETLGRGVGLADIMKVLGHSRVETAMKYVHVDLGRMRKAVEALEKVVKR